MESPAEFFNRIAAITVHYLILTWLSRWFIVNHIVPMEARSAVNVATAVATLVILLVFFLRAAPFLGIG